MESPELLGWLFGRDGGENVLDVRYFVSKYDKHGAPL
jgi:hypothetical protein